MIPPCCICRCLQLHLEAGMWTKARLVLDHHAELSTRQGLGARRWPVSARTWRSTTRATTRPPRRATAACWRRGPGDPVALAALERIASRTGDAPRRFGWPRRPSIAAATRRERAALAMRAAELAETAAHDLPRAAALARRALEAVPATRPRRTCSNGCTRRWGSGASWSRSWSRRGARRERSAIGRRGAAGKSRARRRCGSSGWGRFTRSRLRRSGQGAGALRRVGGAGRRGGRRRCARCCAPPKRPATRWSPPRRR